MFPAWSAPWVGAPRHAAPPAHRGRPLPGGDVARTEARRRPTSRRRLIPGSWSRITQTVLPSAQAGVHQQQAVVTTVPGGQVRTGWRPAPPRRSHRRGGPRADRLPRRPPARSATSAPSPAGRGGSAPCPSTSTWSRSRSPALAHRCVSPASVRRWMIKAGAPRRQSAVPPQETAELGRQTMFSSRFGIDLGTANTVGVQVRAAASSSTSRR